MPREILYCSLGGIIGGLIGSLFGFVLVAPGQIESVVRNGIWFKASASGAPRSNDVTALLRTFMLLPAVVFAVGNSIACALRRGRVTPLSFIAKVSGGAAIAVGTVAALILIGGVLYRAAKPHGPGYENMDGLLPLAIPIWFAIGALIGTAVGGLEALIWVWSWYSRKSRARWLVFWGATALAITLVTVVGLHGLRANSGH